MHYGRVAFDDRAKRLAVVNHSGIQVLDARTGLDLSEIRGHRGVVNCVSVSVDGRTVATGGEDGRIRKWKADDSWESHEFDLKNEGRIGDVAFNPNGKQFALQSAWHVQLRVLPSGAQSALIPGMESARLAYSRDGSRLANAVQYELRMIDAGSGRELFKVPKSVYTAVVAVSPDGKRLAGQPSQVQALYIWDGTTGELQSTLSYERNQLPESTAVTFSVDGKLLYSAHPGAAPQMWNVETNRRVGSLQSARWTGSDDLQLSADGRWLVSRAGYVGVVVWDVKSGYIEHEFDLGAASVRDIAVSPEGRHLLTANGDGTCYVFRLAKTVAERAAPPPAPTKATSDGPLKD